MPVRKSSLQVIDGTRRTDGTIDYHRPQEGKRMTLHASYVQSLFANLEQGRSDAFFEYVADDVNWSSPSETVRKGV